MDQEQPIKHVQDTVRELNAQEAASHDQSTTPNAHTNVVAHQKDSHDQSITPNAHTNAVAHQKDSHDQSTTPNAHTNTVAHQKDSHDQSTTHNAHTNAVAHQKEPIGVQVIQSSPLMSRTDQRGEITIGEALEATALTAGHRPVDYSDAAAIQAAEVRATGRTNIVPGGVAAAAQSAATRNARLPNDEEKTKLGEILSDASSKLPSDKPVTRRDAEGVIGAELRNDPNLCTRPGGVAASVAAAARLNQTNASNNNQNKTD